MAMLERTRVFNEKDNAEKNLNIEIEDDFDTFTVEDHEGLLCPKCGVIYDSLPSICETCGYDIESNDHEQRIIDMEKQLGEKDGALLKLKGDYNKLQGSYNTLLNERNDLLKVLKSKNSIETRLNEKIKVLEERIDEFKQDSEGEEDALVPFMNGLYYILRKEHKALTDIATTAGLSINDYGLKDQDKLSVKMSESGNHVISLCISGNSMPLIPESISYLTELEHLDLSNNDIKELPDAVFDLRKLKKLILHNNKLEAIPDAIGCLTELEELDLESNKLNELPASIGDLRLKIIDLDFNQINNIDLINDETLFRSMYYNRDFDNAYILLHKKDYLVGKACQYKRLYTKNFRVTDGHITFARIDFEKELKDNPGFFDKLKQLDKLVRLDIEFNSYEKYDIESLGSLDFNGLNLESLTITRERPWVYGPEMDLLDLSGLKTKSLDVSGACFSKIPDSLINLIVKKDIKVELGDKNYKLLKKKIKKSDRSNDEKLRLIEEINKKLS